MALNDVNLKDSNGWQTCLRRRLASVRSPGVLAARRLAVTVAMTGAPRLLPVNQACPSIRLGGSARGLDPRSRSSVTDRSCVRGPSSLRGRFQDSSVASGTRARSRPFRTRSVRNGDHFGTRSSNEREATKLGVGTLPRLIWAWFCKHSVWLGVSIGNRGRTAAGRRSGLFCRVPANP
jgi:hypothetical protein